MRAVNWKAAVDDVVTSGGAVDTSVSTVATASSNGKEDAVDTLLEAATLLAIAPSKL